MPDRRAMDYDPDRQMRIMRLRALFRWLLLTALVSALMGLSLGLRAQTVTDAGVVSNLSKMGWQPVGEGTLRWFGFRVYHATLWTPAGQHWQNQQQFALVIEYHRNIESQRLVDASLSEMRRLGLADETSLQRWMPSLVEAFPDVVAGDMIAGVVDSSGKVTFYHGERLTTQVIDPRFASAFFGIWLDERTREPGLRAQLLGASSDG